MKIPYLLTVVYIMLENVENNEHKPQKVKIWAYREHNYFELFCAYFAEKVNSA